MRRVVTAIALTLALPAPGLAHEVDEYLQAALISPGKDHLDVRLRLVPGAAVFSKVLVLLDTNGDGALSDAEKRTYAQQIVRDLKFSLNGQSLAPEIVSTVFPRVDVMKEGLGEIHIALRLPVQKQDGRQRLVFENHHQSAIAAYLANCLVPQDHSVKIVAQHRSEDQSRYELDYE